MVAGRTDAAQRLRPVTCYFAVVAGGACTDNPRGQKGNVYATDRPQRLLQMLADVAQYRRAEATLARQFGSGPPKGKELFMALIWQACMKTASGTATETKPLDRREITDVILITMVLTLASVALGLLYTGSIAGVHSINDPEFRASVYDKIPEVVKKTI